MVICGPLSEGLLGYQWRNSWKCLTGGHSKKKIFTVPLKDHACQPVHWLCGVLGYSLGNRLFLYKLHIYLLYFRIIKRTANIPCSVLVLLRRLLRHFEGLLLEPDTKGFTN